MPEDAKPKQFWSKGRIIGALVVLVIILWIVQIGSAEESSSAQCRSLASKVHGGGDTQFTEITFVDGDFVKGRIQQYVSGDERTVGYWECTTESGEPVLTFYSPAA